MLLQRNDVAQMGDDTTLGKVVSDGTADIATWARWQFGNEAKIRDVEPTPMPNAYVLQVDDTWWTAHVTNSGSVRFDSEPRFDEGIYPAPIKGKMYLVPIHGKMSPKQELSNWGFNGPHIGPLRFVHVTYNTHIGLGFEDETWQAAEAFGFALAKGEDYHSAEENAVLDIRNDMLRYKYWYFGDWEIVIYQGEDCPSE